MRLLVRFMGFLFAAGTVVFLVGVAAVAGAIWHFSKDLPDYSQLQDYEPPVMTRVHAADGALLGEYSKERRLYLPIQAVPKLVINAFLAAEDKNFYEHGGIDYHRHGARRRFSYVAELTVSNRRPQGASTITQQVAKNFLLTNEVSFTRKIKEALLAMRIERAYSKDKHPRALSQRNLPRPRRLRHRGRLAGLFRQVGERIDGCGGGLSRGAAEDAGQRCIRCATVTRAIERRNYVIDRLQENGWITAGRCRQGAQGPARRHQPLAMARTPSPANISRKRSVATSSSAMARRSFMRAACRCAPRSTPRSR